MRDTRTHGDDVQSAEASHAAGIPHVTPFVLWESVMVGERGITFSTIVGFGNGTSSFIWAEADGYE